MKAVAFAVAVFTIAVCLAPAGGATGWHTARASAYSHHSSGSTNGCDGSRLTDDALTVATWEVPCGARVEICYGGRCVAVTRRDSGPYVAGRQFDLNIGVVRALGIPSERDWGVRTIRWRRVS